MMAWRKEGEIYTFESAQMERSTKTLNNNKSTHIYYSLEQCLFFLQQYLKKKFNSISLAPKTFKYIKNKNEKNSLFSVHLVFFSFSFFFLTPTRPPHVHFS